MKKYLIFAWFLVLFLVLTPPVLALEDPRGTANNKVGIHILFTEELQDAARLINTNGGDWGYVTIPIQAGDKNILKWQKFMDQAKQHHVIPLMRLATEGDYFNTKVWRKPTESDILDFANFLSSLDWPTKNKYILVFNEVNRGDEWGGSPNPAEYARLLSYATTTFKSKDENFFIISSGMDNAAPNAPGQFMNQYTFYRYMEEAVPGIFYQIDGLNSHSYPNPAFSQPPSPEGKMSTASFRQEKKLISSFTTKDLPVFITETGWNKKNISEETTAAYYKTAFETIWNDNDVVAVTPFLLKSGEGPFTIFSFLTPDGAPTKTYEVVQQLAKIKGTPAIALPINKTVLSSASSDQSIPVKAFEEAPVSQTPKTIQLAPVTKEVIKWFFKM